MNADTSLSPRRHTEILYFCLVPYRNTVFLSGTLLKNSISVGVRGTEALATTQVSDVRPGHGTKALIWGMTWEVEKKYMVPSLSKCRKG